jgi:hypothetical protein
MPFVAPDSILPGLAAPLDTPKGFAVTPGEDEINHGSDVPQGSVLGAAFRQDNMVGAWVSSETIPQAREDGFNAWDSIKGTKYEPFWDSFIEVQNPRAADAKKLQIDREVEDRKILEAAPWYKSFPAQLAAGAIDLPSLLPGGAFVRGAKGGFSIAKSALTVGGAAGVATTAQEVALQNIQETRPLSESAINIGASVLLGGLLGAGGAKLLSNAEWTAAVKAIDDQLAGGAKPMNEVTIEGVNPVTGTTTSTTIQTDASLGGSAPVSAGAAAVTPIDIEANSIAGKMAGGLAAATAHMNPGLRLLQSPSAATREIGTQLFENSLYLKKNIDGVASEAAVETLMKEWNAGLAQAVRATDDTFSAYRKGGGQLSRTEFREAVGRAMRRADQDDDPFVTKVAQAWRAKVFDPLKDAAIEAKLLPADVSVETAASYFSRMWNRNKLIAQEGRFKGIVRQWVEANAPKWAEAFDKKTERSLAPLRNEIEDLELEKLRRAEELRVRDEGGEVEAGEFTERDIRHALRIVEGGAPKPKGVKTLTQFIADSGGLVDFSGELANKGINNRARPGFVRKERKRAQTEGGGMALDDAAYHAWEAGYFPDHDARPSLGEFIDALADDFFKIRPVLRVQDRDAYRLQELVDRLDQDLARVGVSSAKGTKFATSDEVKGIVKRVFAALDAEADVKIKALKAKLTEREGVSRVERDARFLGEPRELAREISDEVFNTLTGKTTDAPRPEFITVKSRGPLKERTFDIPDHLVEEFLEHDAEIVGRRYARIMGADVELARKFGSVDMVEQLQKIREDYKQLRVGVTSEKEL